MRRKKLDWLAEGVTEVVHFVDAYSTERHPAGNRSYTRELQAHKTSKRGPVPGLPKNYYDATAWKTFSRIQQTALRVKPEKPLPDLVSQYVCSEPFSILSEVKPRRRGSETDRKQVRKYTRVLKLP